MQYTSLRRVSQHGHAVHVPERFSMATTGNAGGKPKKQLFKHKMVNAGFVGAAEDAIFRVAHRDGKLDLSELLKARPKSINELVKSSILPVICKDGWNATA